MRLIDVIGLKQALAVSAILDDKKTIEQIIDEQPTIEPKKGKWLELDFADAWEYKCDQCGKLSDFEENFCPNCGADMRGET